MTQRIRRNLPAELSLPAVGQGAVGVECREADEEVIEMMRPLDHLATRRCIEAERAMNRGLEGGCQVPIGGFAHLEGDELVLQGLVGTPDGDSILRTEVKGPAHRPETLGKRAADDLIRLGASDILGEVYRSDQTQ